MVARNPGAAAKRKASLARMTRKAKPLVASLDRVMDYEFSTHANEQMLARGISPYEALSAVAEPDSVSTNSAKHERYPNARLHDRGDIRVVVNPRNRVVLTVIDMESESRTERKPRVPVLPTTMPAMLPLFEDDKAKAKTDKVPAPRQPKVFEDSEDVNWLLARHDVEDIRYMVISPVLAEKLLSMNTRNRPKKIKDVNEWADEMAAKRWMTTHQGIALDRDMAIVDGQHRLEAIIESGVAVRMPVAVGLDPETFKVIDAGRKRTTADALATAGEKSVFNLAATIKLAYMFDQDWLNGGTRRIHTDVLLAYAEGKEDAFREAVNWSGKAAFHGLHLMRTAISTGYYLLNRDIGNRVLVDEFCEGILIGANLDRDDPCFALRRVASNEGRRILVLHLALFFKAWNKYAVGDTIRLLAFKREVEDFPTLYVPPKNFRRDS